MDRRLSESYYRENLQTRIREIFRQYEKRDAELYEQRIVSRRNHIDPKKEQNHYRKYSEARKQARPEDKSQSDEAKDQPLYLAHTEFDLSEEEQKIVTQIIACSAMPCKFLSH